MIQKTKHKVTEIGEIPKEWEVIEIGDIANEIYRYPTYFNIVYSENGVPEVRGELIKNTGELEKDLNKYRFISKETSRKFSRTVLKEDDFVLSVRGTMGKVAIVPKELEGANITANLMRLSFKETKCYPQFLKQIFLSQIFQKQLINASSSTTIKTIQAPRLKSIKIPLPPPSEQHKIAEILSSIDTRIDIAERERDISSNGSRWAS